MFVGEQLGPYRIIEEIGKGGMAVVYRARQTSIERDVAIKVILKGIAGDQITIQRFQREARLIARLEHPHILPIYDFDGTHAPPYIVMRLLDGGTLRDVMSQKLLSHDEIVHVMQQICSALDYAHRQGIIHRDVKPNNILIDREGNAFVSDLGLARMSFEEFASSRITETGTIMGTPNYMSPEQASGKGEVDHRSDIYSLGVMLFEMLSGQLPYQATTWVRIISMHMFDEIPSIRAFNPELSQSIEDIVTRAMAKNPADRYQTALEFYTALATGLGKPDGTHLAPYGSLFSATVMEHLFIQKQVIEDNAPLEQNKQITVLYANLTEFMELIEGSVDDPQEMSQQLWQQLDSVIAEYGGVVDNHTGDTVLALWGVQSISENAPERAVKAALALQTAITDLGHQLQMPDEPFPTQIGIHTGMTLLKREANSKTYTASGTTVNMVTRLERAAPSGGILISADTYRYVRGVFVVEGAEALRLRGNREALQVYIVLGTKPHTFRQLTYEIEGVSTKMIGREGELHQLIAAFETASEDEETQLITIVGEAGVGKSRLLFELNEWEEKQAGDFWQFPAQGTPQMLNQPFALLRDLFTYRFEVQDNDPPDIVRSKFEAGIESFMGAGTQEQAHVLAYFLGYHIEASFELQNLVPQQLNVRAQKIMSEFFVTAANKNHPAFLPGQVLGAWIQLENIHWADDRSLDFIDQLVVSYPNISLIVCCTARPSFYERRPTWGNGKDSHSRLDLHSLSKRDSRRLAKEILQKVQDLPDDLCSMLVERAEGNPFYMEELVRMLVENHVVLKGDTVWAIEMDRLAQASIPATLTGLLQAHLDSLLPEERRILQRAAVIGRIFWDDAVSALKSADNQPADTDRVLMKLARRNLIAQREDSAFIGVKEFVFASTMLRDVTYDSILKRQQRNYHLEIGHWLAAKSEGAADYSVIIAEHYEIAGEYVEAAKYLYQAGVQARRVSAYLEAVSFFERALNLIHGHVDTEGRRWRAGLLYQLGEISIDNGNYQTASAYMQESLQLARELGEAVQVAEASIGFGQVMYLLNDFDISVPTLREAVELARELGEKELLATALMWFGTVLAPRGLLDEALLAYQEGLSLAEEIHVDMIAARILNMRGELERYRNSYSDAAYYYRQSQEIHKRDHNMYGVCVTTLNLGHVARSLGQIQEAARYYRQAIDLSIEMHIQGITLELFAGVAGLRVQMRDYEHAAEILAVILQHPDLDYDTRRVATPLITDLQGILGDSALKTILERPQAPQWDKQIENLLVELDDVLKLS